MKKLWILVLCSLVLCSAVSMAENVQEITVWHSMSGNNGNVLNQIADAYNQSQSQYKVILEYQGGYEDTIAKLKSTPAGMRPDIVQLAEVNTCWMAYSDYYVPMQDFIDKNSFDTSDFQEAILGYYTLNGKLLSMPFNCSVPCIIYNADVLKAADVSPESLDTLDGVLEASKKIKELGLARYGCVFNGEGFVLENYFGMLGAAITDANNGHSGLATRLVIDENGSGKELFEKWLEFVSDDSTISFGGDSSAASEGKKEFSALPKFKQDSPYNLTVGGGSFWIVNNGDATKDEESFDFIQFIASEEMQALWAASTGYLPITKAVQQNETYQAFVKDNFNFDSVLSAMEQSTAAGAGPLFGVSNTWRSILGNELHMLMEDDSISVDETVSTICEQVNDEIELYNESNGLT